MALQQTEAQSPQSEGMEEMEKKAAHFKQRPPTNISSHLCHRLSFMHVGKMDTCLSIFEAVAQLTVAEMWGTVGQKSALAVWESGEGLVS